MKLTVNGEAEEWADGITIAQLVTARLGSEKGVAAAVDGAVAPRSTWPAQVLQEGQVIELLTAVQGG
jgi:sulfur carrier protein